MPADLTPVEAIPALGDQAQQLYELLAGRLLEGVERAIDPLSQLTNLLEHPRQVQVRGSDQFVTGSRVWLSFGGDQDAATAALTGDLVIPAQLNRTRLQLRASPVLLIAGGNRVRAGTVMVKDAPFVTPAVYDSGDPFSLAAMLANTDGYALGQDNLIGTTFPTTELPSYDLDLPTRREVYVRPMFAIGAGDFFAWCRVDWIAHLQIPQPEDHGPGRCGCH